MLKNWHRHEKVLLSSFCLNGHTTGSPSLQRVHGQDMLVVVSLIKQMFIFTVHVHIANLGCLQLLVFLIFLTRVKQTKNAK